MTAADLSKRLGISRRSLFLYRKDYQDRAPKDFNNLKEWQVFVASVRTRPTYLPELMSRRLKSGEDWEYNAQSERKERIIKLQLTNAIRDQQWKNLRCHTLRIAELVETMDVLTRAVSAEVLRIPGEVAQTLAGKEAPEIQTCLETVIHASLDRLSCQDLYLRASSTKAVSEEPAVQSETGGLCISPISSIMSADRSHSPLGQSLAIGAL
jgi:hypothetical protein